MTDRQARSFDIGSLRCTLLLDGYARYEPDGVFANVPRDTWTPLVTDRLDADGYLPLPYQPVLVRGADATVLIDAGAGPELAAEWEDPVGRTGAALDALGLGPGDIEIVLLTHAHPDHVGGLTQQAGDARVPVFANARHVLTRTEREYWSREDLAEPFSGMGTIARMHLDPLADAGLLDLIEGEIEVAPGIRAIPTPGHTPGHVSFELAEGELVGIVAGDAIPTEWSFEHPDWYGELESDPAVVVSTRASLLERAAADGAVVSAYHVEGVGRVRSTPNGFVLEREP